MSGGSPLHPQMGPILVAGERLYSQLLLLLGYPHVSFGAGSPVGASIVVHASIHKGEHSVIQVRKAPCNAP